MIFSVRDRKARLVSLGGDGGRYLQGKAAAVVLVGSHPVDPTVDPRPFGFRWVQRKRLVASIVPDQVLHDPGWTNMSTLGRSLQGKRSSHVQLTEPAAPRPLPRS